MEKLIILNREVYREVYKGEGLLRRWDLKY